MRIDRRIALWALLLYTVCPCFGATLATFQTSVGRMELELYDEDKPITVSNFVKYVTSGQFTNQFIQRWEPSFVIQGGGYRVTNTSNGPRIVPVPTFGEIRNEYSSGRTFSNTNGTIAMARRDGAINSATSQWFINLKENRFLDTHDEGFTVFGRVTSGYDILNLFIPSPPTNGNIHLLDLGASGLQTVPALEPITTVDQLFTNLIYVDIRLRRNLGLTLTPTRPGQRRISWNSVAGVANVLEFSSVSSFGNWTVYTNVPGTGGAMSFIDASGDPGRAYRVKLFY
jgi:cyclophilin family peptidyl-prolyl cis-trans isomerase